MFAFRTLDLPVHLTFEVFECAKGKRDCKSDVANIVIAAPRRLNAKLSAKPKAITANAAMTKISGAGLSICCCVVLVAELALHVVDLVAGVQMSDHHVPAAAVNQLIAGAGDQYPRQREAQERS